MPPDPADLQSLPRQCAADRVSRTAIDAMVFASANPIDDDGHTDCYYAGLLLAALAAVIEDDEAISRARRALLNSPPYSGKHSHTERLAHMRAALRAAFDATEVSPDAYPSTSQIPVLNDEEQEVMDHILAAMGGIQKMGLRTNSAELAQGVHVLQGFVIQHMLERVAAEQWGTGWYGEPTDA